MKQKPHRDGSDQEEGRRSIQSQEAGVSEVISGRPVSAPHRAWLCPGWVQPRSWGMTSAFPPLLRGPGVQALAPDPWVHPWLAAGRAGGGRVSSLARERGRSCGSRELGDLHATAVSLTGDSLDLSGPQATLLQPKTTELSEV